MGYSKITSVEVFNFMVYHHAKITFDDTNIINMKGYNSSGKSTMLKAIAVCLTNMFSQSQAKLIRHGEDYFRVIVTFDDGISIVRDKYINGQSLYEVYKDEECIFTTKEGRKLTKIDGVPDVIQNYLGLCETSLGCLNYQSRQDRLWLIETKGSENYASLNEILKTEEIARANQLLNTDKNKLNGEIAGIEATLMEVRQNIEAAKAFSEDLLIALGEREDLCNRLVAKYRYLESLTGIIASLEKLRVIPEIQKISADRFGVILDLSESAEKLSNMRVLPSVTPLDDSRFVSINRLKTDAESYSSIDKVNQPMVEKVDNSRVLPFIEIMDTLTKLNEAMTKSKTVEDEYTKVSAKLDKAVKAAEAKGIKFVQCDNCGTYMEVEVS